ncbi:tRNA wybutosine-synthesizing protein 5 [Trichonephila inaurata madagascariensis]|uniref:tRNA wybutosine-synthesizing protein 5 n=1 Tax=Trichonephila inaurata madagascariensis TaxID=2747483 RepID=A0A8X7CRX6_9ARAC|nr:tRNA wybutosine-synthesizing protein 5 [Trichonephila inaurata madagascariensis]
MADISKKQICIVINPEEVDGFIGKRLPFILRGANIGSCTEKWTPDYLSEVLGNEEVKIHVSEFQQLDFLKKNFLYKTLLFEKLLRRASESKHEEENYFISPTECYYLRSVGKDARKDVADIRQQFPAVANDILFPNFVPKQDVFSSIFRIASKGVSIWTHYDVMDNALIQVKGRKKAVLFPPTDALNLYLNGDKSEVLDIENPDFNKFPNFKNVTWYECCLLPGDILYIPAFWFHNMKYLDFGIAVNVFWKELDPIFYDKKDPYGNKDLLPAQQAFASLDKAMASLSKLPPSYKEFYCKRLIALIQKKMES